MSANEIILNLALNGDELKSVILRHFQKLVDNECMLSGNVAFARVSYTILLRLHMDNPHHPVSENQVKSERQANDDVAKSPQLSSIEAPPLTNVEGGGDVAGLKLTHNITSGNAERLRAGMPIPCLVPQQDGTRAQESIIYPPGSFPDLGEGDVTIEDVSMAARQDWELPLAVEKQPEQEASQEAAAE